MATRSRRHGSIRIVVAARWRWRRPTRSSSAITRSTRRTWIGGRRTRTRPTRRSSGSTGIAAITSADAHCCGAVRAIATAISTSRRTRERASLSTGQSATGTSLRGTTTSRRDAGTPGARAARAACQHRPACWRGCPFCAYLSTQSSTLPPARATGRLTLKTFAIVTDLVYDRDRKRARSVRVLDAVTGQTSEYSARVIFLCASTLNSTWILMRSANDVWPGGLGSSSGELGHNLMDHHFRCGANGDFAGHEHRY